MSILVIGSANVDLCSRVRALPRPGETITGSDLVTVFGGKGANQAVAAARLGGNVRLCGCLGDDAYGEQYLRHLSTERVDTSSVNRIAGVPTGCAMILVDDSGENVIVVAPGANAAMQPDLLPSFDTVPGQRAVLLLQLEIPFETVTAAAKQAQSAGMRVILNPSPVTMRAVEVCPLVDVLVVNRGEAASLTGIAISNPGDCRAAGQKLRDSGAGSVIITSGSQPTYVCADGLSVEVPTVPVTPVDTVGAGDTFAGALAVQLAQQRDLEESVRFANAAAALSTTQLGAQTAMPRLEEVVAFMSTLITRSLNRR